jgi:CheY-like chemotaxis protein/anti-sigma regulatory factor (Ser/Thr protein kinase)
LRQENRLRAQVESSLRDAHLSKTRFMSATSHDLLQPINAARLFTAALKPQLSLEEGGSTARIVDQIDTSLQRAEQLISELREISRLDSGKQIPRPGNVSTAQMFAALAAEFTPAAALKGLEFRAVTSSAWLYSDPSLLYRIIQNLVSNAIKYTRQGRVVLGLRRRAQGVDIQIWDTGPGIPQQDQMRIFQEFERLPGHGGDREEGLGLGLAIVQRYADLLEHRVELQSTQGRGTVFSVTVPYGDAQVADDDAGQAIQEQSDQDLAKLRILCLDNDLNILEGMAQLLKTMGAVVSSVSDGQALLQACRTGGQLPDIILADYHLDGGETGVNAVLEARKDSGVAMPCIVISADDSEQVRDLARSVGFRFLPKPVNPARLRALILALVANAD